MKSSVLLNKPGSAHAVCLISWTAHASNSILSCASFDQMLHLIVRSDVHPRVETEIFIFSAVAILSVEFYSM